MEPLRTFLSLSPSRVLARTLMVQGTSSGAGKSLLTAGLCRIFARRGVRVLPFKAQNMSNNAAVCADGGEVGRAQALQARACGVAPSVSMNPILLKPLSDTRSEVIVLGRRDTALTAMPWMQRRDALWGVVRSALREVREGADLVLIEGAGSPAEINLPDLVNMSVAEEADAPVLLVSDIDRGGAFASLYGTWALLPEADRGRIRGFILNKFRGDAALLDPAPRLLFERTGVPTLGVVPWTPFDLPEEDAASLRDRGEGDEIRIAAIRSPHLSNFDDLDPLATESGVVVRWTDQPESLDRATAIILPGTRNTTGDLRWLWETGLAAAIRARAAAGVPVVGLCGGYQMLGELVADPLGLEGGGEVRGLGLLPLRTSMELDKTTRVTNGQWVYGSPPVASVGAVNVTGYEIHHGDTEIGPDASCLVEIEGRPGGAIRGKVWGCYLHGLFANDELRRGWLRSLGAERRDDTSWEDRIDAELDRLADLLEASLDIAAIDRLIGNGAWGS